MSRNAPTEYESAQAGLTTALATARLIPVITVDSVDQGLSVAQALWAAQYPVLEFTLRTQAGAEVVRRLKADDPHRVLGVGSVRTLDDYHRAIDVGADFVVSPGSTATLLDYGATAAIPLLPGIATLSDMMRGYERGYRLFKFFPAAVSGGTEALKAFAGPFPDVRFIPTGGITRESMGEYLALENVPAVGGTWLAPTDWLARGEWQQVRDAAARDLASLADGD